MNVYFCIILMFEKYLKGKCNTESGYDLIAVLTDFYGCYLAEWNILSIFIVTIHNCTIEYSCMYVFEYNNSRTF